MAFKCIFTMVKPDLTDDVVTAAKKAGATGATIVPAKGTGIREAKSYFGLTLEVRTDIILFLLQEEKIPPVLEAIEKAGRFDEPGTGIAFIVPVDDVLGLRSQIGEKNGKD
jgi:nitrogen regulatory protein PII